MVSYLGGDHGGTELQESQGEEPGLPECTGRAVSNIVERALGCDLEQKIQPLWASHSST